MLNSASPELVVWIGGLEFETQFLLNTKASRKAKRTNNSGGPLKKHRHTGGFEPRDGFVAAFGRPLEPAPKLEYPVQKRKRKNRDQLEMKVLCVTRRVPWYFRI